MSVAKELQLVSSGHGFVPKGDGWFVLNARDAPWYARQDDPVCWFEDPRGSFPQLGINLRILEPGQAMAMYHWEADQEDFLVLAGEALAIVEGEERPLRQWDLLHCPPGANHVVIGGGEGPCLVLAVGARDRTRGEEWGGFAVDETARRHGASVERDTTDAAVAYEGFPPRGPVSYRDGWLPG
jgi:uncharacterized cupin superfamily protein